MRPVEYFMLQFQWGNGHSKTSEEDTRIKCYKTFDFSKK